MSTADGSGIAGRSGTAAGAGPVGGASPGGRSAGSWILRPATLEDVEEIAFAELELFPDEAWNVFQLAEEIEHPYRRYVVAVETAPAVPSPTADELTPDAQFAPPARSPDGRTLGAGRPHSPDGRSRGVDRLRSPDGRPLGGDRPGADSHREGALLGYAGIMLAGDLADLHTIGTRREGQGIGRALLAWCEEQARRGGAERMLLEVRDDNARARAVYSAAGYREIDRRRGYYRIRGRRIDALVMQRDLADPDGPSA